MSGCSLFDKPEETIDVEDIVLPIEHDYSEVEEYMIDWDEMFDFDLEEYFVYIYSTKCSHCVEIKNQIVEKALEEKNVYFVKSSAKVIQKNDISSSIGASFAGDISILGYPSLIKIVNGICTKNVAGKTAILSALY